MPATITATTTAASARPVTGTKGDVDAPFSSTDEAAFRARCRTFLEAHVVPAAAVSLETGKAFLAELADAGLAGLTYPTAFGGAGLTSTHEKIWREEKSAFPAQDSEFIISHGMCLPMIAEFGTDEQRQAFVPDMISGRTLWCQMFSEPGAGSDVASLQSRAELDGDEWIINGQKVWTTLAHRSDYGLVVVRTDPDQSKHRGISMFIVDMRAPGVEIRPIHQIDGGSHFNEVFFTDVRIPNGWLVGEVNAGWSLATSMLMYERVAIGSSGAGRVSQPLFDMLVGIVRANGSITSLVVRDRLMQLYCMESTRSMVALRTRAELKAGKTPGPGGSLGKLMGSNIAWFYRSIALEIAGPVSVAWETAEPAGAFLNKHVINSFSSGIAGGTDEIQRNIIGERVLGLPREPSVDTAVPFRELKVGTQRPTT
ncbi:MAG: acyl-CoA dehydrogenase family protein [Ilumatobacteraceae bacterium]